jgi:predicted ribosomally synthesized peptide with SipW-like signal peptide
MKNKRLLLSLLVIGVVVAGVAGATYAIFTDQAQSDIQTFSAGTVDITVTASGDDYDDDFPTTFHDTSHFTMGTGWAPGDQTNQQITINNVGTLDVIYTVYLDYDYNPGDIWRCDPNGNDLHVWATNDTGVIASGGSQQVTLYAEMPLAAGNACQNTNGDLRVTVHAVQQRNVDPDFTCVKLVYKDQANDWLPYGPGNTLGTPTQWQGQHGNVCYKVDTNGDLRVVVNAYNLTDNAYYQLALNGQGGCSVPESITFAGMTTDLYHSGWSSGSTTALAGSCSNTWDEGVYNFYGTDGELQADDGGTPLTPNDGSISLDFTIDGSDPEDTVGAGLPTGTYNDVKFIVKEITGYSGSAPSHTDHGTNWQPLLMEIRALNFTIP